MGSIHEFPLRPDSVVWIVGAYGGATARFYEEMYDPVLHLYEPQEPFAATLATMFAANRKVTVHPYGLSDHEGAEPMALAGCDGATFLYEKGYRGALSEPCALRDIGAETWPDTMSLLFLNCEGSEFAILHRLLNTNRLAQVENLLVQFHPGPAGPGVEDAERLSRVIDHTHRRLGEHGLTWRSWRRHE